MARPLSPPMEFGVTAAPHVQLVAPPATTARHQLLALLASSHPRCGAGSPARQFCSSTTLAQLLWRDHVASRSAAEARLTAVLEPRYRAHESWSVSLGVSRSTLGLTSECIECSRTGLRHWVTPATYLLKGGSIGSFRDPFALRRMTEDRGAVTVQSKLWCLYGAAPAATHKWCIASGEAPSYYYYNTGEPGCSLVISKVEPGAESDETAEPPVSVKLTSEIGITVSGVFFNKMVPDEAVVLIKDNWNVDFTLIDVPKTYKTGRLFMTMSTTTSWVQYHSCGFSFTCDFTLIMRREKTDGAVVFIMKPIGYYSCDRIVYQVDSTTGEVKKVTEQCLYLSQISGCLFCTAAAKPTSYQLWDCNNTDQPLRCIQTDAIFDQFVGGICGLLFAVREQYVVVMEATSGKGPSLSTNTALFWTKQ
ncbi:hypothetical protein Pelo_5905 [Pelomyxa schiedti]|nr:hypothetical protein Pelo_5905 [Pelomyxa schiedti]